MLVGLGLWMVLQSLLRPINMLMNGAAVVKFQIVTALLMGAVNLTLSILLVQVVGVAGVVYGTVLALTFFSLLPAVFYLPRIFERLAPGRASGTAETL
jgi:hypothetical protein